MKKGDPEDPSNSGVWQIRPSKNVLEVLLRQNHYQSIEELQGDLDRWLVWYNTERPHQGRYNWGRTPLHVIRDFQNQTQQDSKAA